MRELDDKRQFQYFRMSTATFDQLLGLVALRIQHSASRRAPVSNAERLVVTLRFLAAGVSQQALAASYKFGNATVCNIIKEVCQALWAGLKEEVKFPQGAQWGAITSGQSGITPIVLEQLMASTSASKRQLTVAAAFQLYIFF